MRKKVLITDGNSRAALAITRSLGKRGYEVHVSAVADISLAGRSKYCHQTHTYPDPTANRERFVDAIEGLVRELKVDILLPVTDICLLPIVGQLERLQSICSVPFSSRATIERAASKEDITQLARDLGVATPQSRTVADKGQSDRTDWDGVFPVVIKPSRSRVRDGDGWLYTGVDYAHTQDELDEKLSALPDTAYPILLQERVNGPGIGLFYCFDKGRRVATFAHRRIHEKPPSGGVSVLRESVAADPVADEFGQRLLKALNWHGVAMVEFKLDERDNTAKLMEINGRFWGSLQLAVDAGVDFPDLLARIACGETVDSVDEYKLGVRSRWLCGELDLLLLYLFKSRKALNLPVGHPPRLLSALRVINPFVRGQKLEVLRLSDIRPWLYEMRQWFKGAA